MSENSDSVLIRHIIPRNFLSFGPDNCGIELCPLNLIIGPNGSGKSNLLEAISFMRSAPTDMRQVVREGGGVLEWIWKGDSTNSASVEWLVKPEKGNHTQAIKHLIKFRALGQGFSLDDERVENAEIRPGEHDHYFFYRFNDGHPMVNTRDNGKRGLARDTIEADRSILAQRRDPETYPELSWLASNYEKIRIYREWTFGRSAVFREPQKADMRNDALEEDFSNLGLFLNRLKTRFPTARRSILSGLKDLYDGIEDFNVQIEGGTVQVFFHEGNFVVPATRLSDGTLRYLCLLAILCDPEPPPLICIEEPELGLHPDILPRLADRLREASRKTQLVVTTHSDVLVDAMTETPETVIVCSKEKGMTQLERLSRENLDNWLDEYRLGELWTKGEIGGNALVTAKLYIEGGSAKESKIRCRQSFKALLEKAGLKGSMPLLVASGSREATFRDFRNAHGKIGDDQYIAMLVDSEDPVHNIEKPWDHLKSRDHWDRPSAASDTQVFLMTTSMETWIVADRAALQHHFHHCLRDSSLPVLQNLEVRDRKDISPRTRSERIAFRSSGARPLRTHYELFGYVDSPPLFQVIVSLE